MSAAKIISLPIQRSHGSGVLLCIDGSLLNTYGGRVIPVLFIQTVQRRF
jgi:hypothetical protein